VPLAFFSRWRGSTPTSTRSLVRHAPRTPERYAQNIDRQRFACIQTRVETPRPSTRSHLHLRFYHVRLPGPHMTGTSINLCTCATELNAQALREQSLVAQARFWARSDQRRLARQQCRHPSACAHVTQRRLAEQIQQASKSAWLASASPYVSSEMYCSA
jgi:hypothetical protein